MSRLETPAETPEPHGAPCPEGHTYGNLGEVRAHLLPSKACRPRAPASLSSDPGRSPPPLPKKTLTRARSLPTGRATCPGSAGAAQPLQRSVQGQAEPGPACPPAQLTLSLPSGHLQSPEALHAALAALQLQGLGRIHARLGARLLGGRPGPCRPDHRLRLLDSTPCLESGDAQYYRVVRVHEHEWHVLAAKVPRPGAAGARGAGGWGVELQASLPPHFNLQGLCGLLPEGALPGAPWRGPAALATEVPERTAAQWLAEAGGERPAERAWGAAVLLLQLSAALERLEARGAALAELRPDGLLLLAPRGCAARGPPRLLLADFGRLQPRPEGPPGAHALPLARLLRALLGPAAPAASPLAAGLERLAARLPRTLPSAAQTRGALQALLWGPGPELRAHAAPRGPWLRAHRALLVVRLAERAAGGDMPDLEDWLCCGYLAEATEDSLAQALDLLWG